jgi:oxalyl-CoA decarboxylase
MSAVLKTPPAPAEAQALTDGFHLVIDALKLNDIDTIFGLPGIPVTDLCRMAQAEGMRVISFRHEQHAGNAAAAAGFLTQKPGICLTVSAPGFLNGLTALANATTNCFPMILISGSSEREIVDLQQGDYEEMDQLAIAKPLCKAAFRVLHAEDIGVGVARAIRAALSGRPGGVYLDLPAKLFAQTMDAVAGKQSLIKVVDPAPRQIPAPDSVKRALDLLKSAKRPVILLGKGAAYAQADADIRALVEKTGIPYLPMSMAKGLLPDTHLQSAAAARSYVLAEADVVLLVGARLNWLLSHGKGKTWGADKGAKQFIQIDISPTEADSNVAIAAPLVGDIGSCVAALLAGIDASWAKPPADWTGAITERKDKNLSKMAVTLAARPSPMSFQSALSVIRDQVKARPDAIIVNEGANTLDFARSIVDMYEPRKRLDVGTWGIMGIGDRRRRRQRLRLQRHGSRDHLPLRPADLRRRLQQQRRLPRHRCEPVRYQGRGTDRVREERALRQADGSLRWRRRARHHGRRTAEGAGRGRRLRQADADQRRHQRSGRHRERPHRQPQPAKRGQEVTARRIFPANPGALI